MLQIEQDITKVMEERKEIQQIIKGSKNRRDELMLNLRYINGLSVYDIANQIGKSEKWTREMIKNAVNSLKIPEKG